MQDRLRSAPLFTALDDDAAAAMRASMVEVRLTKGDVLFTEGETGDKLYLIESGKIKLGHTASDGRESLIAVLGPARCSASCPCSIPDRARPRRWQ